jgi:hypothetical protein
MFRGHKEYLWQSRHFLVQDDDCWRRLAGSAGTAPLDAFDPRIEKVARSSQTKPRFRCAAPTCRESIRSAGERAEVACAA